jgi:hypothetical protein
MDVKKIFITLITIVACVVIGALVLNVLLPNVVTGLVNSVEDYIYRATKISFDFNGDGKGGNSNRYYNSGTAKDTNGISEGTGVGVDGFQ